MLMDRRPRPGAGVCSASATGAGSSRGEMTVSHAWRTRAVEIPLADVSPRFTPASRFDGGAADQQRGWFGIQAALMQQLQPWLDDGWEIVPRSLGPRCLHIAVQRASHWAARLGFDWRDKERYVSSATVLLQKPVH